MTLLKGSFAARVGLAAITGAGVGLSFTVLNTATGAWFLIPFVAITLGLSPVLAGWLSPGLKNVLLFPIGVLVSLSAASAIGGPLSYDSHPIGFIIMLTLIYGGGTSVLFFAGWIARQHLRRLRGHRMIVSHLAIASLVAVCFSVALSVLFLVAPVISVASLPRGGWFPVVPVLASMGLIGVVAGIAIISSDRHRGRWRFLGLGLSLLYLAASVAPPVFLVTAHLYGPVALALVVLAVWNVFKWKRGGAP